MEKGIRKTSRLVFIQLECFPLPPTFSWSISFPASTIRIRIRIICIPAHKVVRHTANKHNNGWFAAEDRIGAMGMACRTRLGAGPQFVLALKHTNKTQPPRGIESGGPLKKPHQFAAAANILRRDIQHQKHRLKNRKNSKEISLEGAENVGGWGKSWPAKKYVYLNLFCGLVVFVCGSFR